MKPITRWAIRTHEWKLALGNESMILTYRLRLGAAYDCSKDDGERVVKIRITEAK